MGVNENSSRSVWNLVFMRLSEEMESSGLSFWNQCVEPLQGFDRSLRNPGRCPGLAWLAPLVLKQDALNVHDRL